MLRIICFNVLLVLALAKPQYAPSGWKPKGAPFTLPKEYLPAQQQGANQIEITKERVEYLGQLVGESTTNTPDLISVTYLPPVQQPDDALDTPATENYIRVQGLPSNTDPALFSNNQQQNTRVTPLKKNQVIAPQSQLQKGQLRQEKMQNQLSSFKPNQQQPKEQVFVMNQQQQPQFGKQTAPANTYGVPQDKNDNDDEDLDPTVNDDNENEPENTSNETQDVPQTNIAIANSINGNGQYYILTPDNMLQRVLFMTTQNQEEALTNGFTAQLRYMPVEPIRDPIYAYNEQGQLVRIFRK